MVSTSGFTVLDKTIFAQLESTQHIIDLLDDDIKYVNNKTDTTIIVDGVFFSTKLNSVYVCSKAQFFYIERVQNILRREFLKHQDVRKQRCERFRATFYCPSKSYSEALHYIEYLRIMYTAVSLTKSDGRFYKIQSKSRR